MKQLKTNLSLILVACAALFFVFSFSTDLKSAKRKSEEPLLGTNYRPQQQKPFVLIIPSYNNEKYCLKNLLSVFEQEYENYRVIYIDDASTDSTFQKVEQLTQSFDMEERVTLIRNETNQKAAINTYRAVQMCEDDEIVVLLDGDDWLAHSNVLNYLNIVYENPDVWLTYGSHLDYPTYKRARGQKAIPENVLEEGSYRLQIKKSLAVPCSRTAYAGLYKQIRLASLLDEEGHFIKAASGEAFMVPMIEMAARHSHHIRDILYISNRETVIAEDKVHVSVLQKCKEAILAKTAYEPRVHWKRIAPDPKVDLVIHSKESPMELYALLESIEQYVSGARTICIYVHAGSEEYERAYQEVATRFPKYRFLPLEKSWKELLTEISKSGEANYLLSLARNQIFQKPVDLAPYADALFATRADCLTFSVAPEGIPLNQGITASRRNEAVDFGGLVLFPTQELASGGLFLKGITLACEEEKTAPCRLGENRDELLTKFLSGLKIDLSTFTHDTPDEIAYIDR
jgi:glycosyltransferase involved in cell wall biosynthesis